MDIKQSDKLKLWLFCGFELNRLQYTDGDYQYHEDVHLWIALPICLDTLYKYAIPKLQKEGILIELSPVRYKGFTAKTISANGYSSLALEIYDSPTEALYNAIMKVIDNEVKHEIPEK